MYLFQSPPTPMPNLPGDLHHSTDTVEIMLNVPQLLVSYILLEDGFPIGMTQLCMRWETVVALSLNPAIEPGSFVVMLLSPVALNGQASQPWSLDRLAEIWQADQSAYGPMPAIRYVLTDGQYVTFACNTAACRDWQRVVRMEAGTLRLEPTRDGLHQR